MSALQLGLFDDVPESPAETVVIVGMPNANDVPENPDQRWQKEHLGQFCGTEQWHRWSFLYRDWLLTDGAQYVAQNYGAFWLMDAIASYHRSLRRYPLQVWTLLVAEDRNWTLVATDGDYKEIARLTDVYTDFPIGEFVLYAAQSGDHWVIMLTSEY
jgi:hypothetical protein